MHFKQVHLHTSANSVSAGTGDVAPARDSTVAECSVIYSAFHLEVELMETAVMMDVILSD